MPRLRKQKGIYNRYFGLKYRIKKKFVVQGSCSKIKAEGNLCVILESKWAGTRKGEEG